MDIVDSLVLVDKPLTRVTREFLDILVKKGYQVTRDPQALKDNPVTQAFQVRMAFLDILVKRVTPDIADYLVSQVVLGIREYLENRVIAGIMEPPGIRVILGVRDIVGHLASADIKAILDSLVLKEPKEYLAIRAHLGHLGIVVYLDLAVTLDRRE